MKLELEELGLSKNESAIYLFLLKKGSTTTGSIIKETGIANSRVYESLNSLIRKGIVSYNVQNDGKHFQAADPRKLIDIEEERKERIEKIVPELMKMRTNETGQTTSAIFEGFEGFKTAFKNTIDNCPTNGEMYILGFSDQPFATKSLRTFITNMNLKTEKKKQRLKIILDSSVRKTLGKDRAKEKYTQVRYMPEGYVSPAAINIFEDYVYTFLWEENPTVFMIKNKRVAESHKKYFDFLWSIAKP